ncbi:MAG: 2,3-bisphosphoglycerate-dependent phosphoglycerate mutase [Candidatus Vogelbacteria bacterium CG10_big_fil_rev_8_21_14_0_10_49_38]|uniref:2,3-bisphosphoglycerate-dependent phosphoglycerate mutase n=1 Tax=Candidatus Vogelbacteria bacterium CG10_big_fil_rev_8_21_14_0_10_49_38 TaxID=1975043 RepID=A0A2H0RHJ7_9BACT|nr:MAG: hypothetical protein BK006_02045 [bacterium CG10_49_38]PIR46031.1 MAG: 2,3-bisphosphoglycerate-dependent phosphoglycerate mutase [Candidatus Vogelbacteria bacterium CG10_big_fil_rev_8_21_14_0_10_49_38]
MAKLILMRHLQSEWNQANRFTGWHDVALSPEGEASAPAVAQKIAGETIDQVYTSPLIRNRETTRLVLENLKLAHLPVVVDPAFNERRYGELEGLNKDEVKARYGAEQVRRWRRGWAEAPPGGESLKEVTARVLPVYQNLVETDLRAGKNVLIVASHNSLRALAKEIEQIPDEEIAEYEIQSGGVVVYDLDPELNLINKELR